MSRCVDNTFERLVCPDMLAACRSVLFAIRLAIPFFNSAYCPWLVRSRQHAHACAKQPCEIHVSDRPASRRFAGIFACAYPIVAHLAIARGSTRWTIVAIALLAAAVLAPALSRGRVFAWLLVPVLALGCWALVRVATPVMLLYVAPVLAPAFLAWFFGHTLSGGRTPFIAQLVEIVHRGREPPEPAVWPYARSLTRAWTIFFIVLASLNLTLAALADPHGLLLSLGVHPPFTVPQYWWSLFANVIGYVAVAAFFVIEYAYRRRRFPQQPFRNLYDFLKQVGAVMPRLLGHRE